MPTLSATSSEAGGELLGDGGAALREVELKIDALGGEEALVHGDVDGPERGLAAERAGNDLVRGLGRLGCRPKRHREHHQAAAQHGPNGIHERQLP